MSTVSEAATVPSTPIDQRHAIETFQALVAEHGLQVEEWDITFLDETYRDKIMAFYTEEHGQRVLVVPIGQDPAERLHTVRRLLAHMGVTV